MLKQKELKPMRTDRETGVVQPGRRKEDVNTISEPVERSLLERKNPSVCDLLGAG